MDKEATDLTEHHRRTKGPPEPKFTVNCHFFDTHQIEMDVLPDEIDSSSKADFSSPTRDAIVRDHAAVEAPALASSRAKRSRSYLQQFKPCKLIGEFELPSGKVACAYKCGHWPEANISVLCDSGQKCKLDIPGGGFEGNSL